MGQSEIIAACIALAAVAFTVARHLSLRRASRALEESNNFAATIIDNAGEGIIVYDRSLRYLTWNRFMEELTGLSRDAVVGRLALEVFPHLREQRVDLLLQRALSGEAVSAPELEFYVPGSDRRGWVATSYRPQYDADRRIIGVIATVRDITEQKIAAQEAEYQAYHDALTGLANRRLFLEHLTLALALAQRRAGIVSVLYLDLDQFKLVNDSLGHSFGDDLLRQVAARLRRCIREGDTVARIGGDEFTIVLQELESREDAARLAEKVLHTISAPIEVRGHRLYVTASIGITFFPDDGTDAESLLRNADNAMYRAKADGRNSYQMGSRELSRAAQERLTLENGLHRAIERQEFELYYQPQIDLKTLRIIGTEALIRWRHPKRGIIAPAEFISVAEDRGHIVIIGDWVVRTACEHAKRFREAAGEDLRVAVNISARQFREPSFVSMVEQVITTTGTDPRLLELEITENVAMENVDLTLTQLSRLRRIGVGIAIDDFGTGHSSLNYLKRFPIDTIKIDRGFVEDLPFGHEDAAIVHAIVSLAREMRLRVVAEGVEREEQVEFLRSVRCPEVQGYHFGKPMPMPEFVQLLEKRRDEKRLPAL